MFIGIDLVKSRETREPASAEAKHIIARLVYIGKIWKKLQGRRHRDRMDLILLVQSAPIATKVVSLNTTHGEVYLIQQYVIKFVSDL